MRFRLEVMDVGTQKCGQTSLTHVLTHTGLARSGLGRFKWIHGVAKLWEKAPKWQLLADKVMSTAAHNPEAVGSSPTPAKVVSGLSSEQKPPADVVSRPENV